MSFFKRPLASRRRGHSHGQRPASRTVALRCEALEQRQLLTTIADFSDGATLKIYGDSSNNAVEVAEVGSSLYQVRELNGTGFRSIGLYRNPRSIRFDGYAGNDAFYNTTSLPASFTGGSGNDYYRGGTGGDAFIDRESSDRFSPGAGFAVTGDTPTGTLLLTGSPGNDDVVVYNSGGGNVSVYYGSGQALNIGGITRIVANGGDGNDTIYNTTSLPSTINGGNGDDVVYGGRGTDLFLGSPGNDIYDTRSYQGGSDQLQRNGYRGILRGPGVSVGLVNGALSPSELSATGSLTVSRNGDYLTFNGPSGAGFRLRGSWYSWVSNGQNYYASLNTPVLESALGDIPLASGWVIIGATSSGVADVGTYSYGYWSGLAIDTTSAASRFHQISDLAGLGIKLSPTAGQLGLALGSTLKATGINAPVNNAVPYFNFSVSTSSGLTFGGNTIRPGGQSVTVQGVFDPSDPFLFVRADASVGNNPVDEFALGWSTRGQIPFTPRTAPSGVSESIYGNVYAQANVKLRSYPIKIDGETVIDLDANDDGRLLDVSGNRLARIVRGDIDLSDIAGALSDVRIGLNGTGSVELSKKNASGSELFKFSIPLSDATALITPSNIAFRATGKDLFDNTPLDGKIQVSSFDVQGHYGIRDQSWSLSASSSTAGIGGYSFGAIGISASSATQSIDVSARYAPPMGFGATLLSGSIQFNGDFSLHGTATPINIHTSVTTLYASAGFTLSRTGSSITFVSTLHASFSQDVGVGYLYGSLDATINLYASGNTVTLAGHGTASGGLSVRWVGTFGIDTSFSVDTSGFSIELPYGVPDLTVSW